MKTITDKNQKGFTLIETLVAVAIFASAIAGLIAITAGGVANSNFVKNKFTAGYLALEGAELVHNIRDTVAISDSTNGWAEVLTALSPCTTEEGCFIDTWNSFDPILTPTACDDGEGCPNMSYNTESSQFNYGSSDPINNFQSIFKRTITVESISLSEIRVTSRVDWLQGSEPHNVTYAYNLLNWTSP